jgi:anti-sigma B factor antagonist
VLLSEFAPRFLSVDQRDDTIVVSVDVPMLTEDLNMEQFGHELFALVEQHGCRKMVVRLRDVQLITSSGLGKMITLHRKMHRHQGRVVFCELTNPVEEVLTSSRLITYLHVASTLDAALGAVQSA